MKTGLTLLITLLFAGLAQAESRNWTNAAGKTINGELKSVSDGKANLIVNGRKFEVEVSSLSEADQKFIADWQSGAAEEMAAKAAAADSPILSALEGNMVILDGKRLKKLEPENLGQIEVVAFYSSASWCGPCHAFTPSLIKEYNSLKKKYDNFELVLISSDNSESDWEEYVEEYKMPWPALKHGSREKSTLKSGNKANFIPSILIVSADGTVLDDASGGASSSLKNLERILKEKKSSTASR